MDRKGQLRNVAFGRAWSEQIAGEEALQHSLELIEGAAARTADEDLRESAELEHALTRMARRHPKGAELAASWRRALNPHYGRQRVAELSRIAGLFRAGIEARLKR